jgi:hypothetical protein
MSDRDEVGALWSGSGVPGLSLAYAVGDGPVVPKIWGVASVDDGTPVTPETIFRSGSVTKVVTAYAVSADLDQAVGRYRLPTGSTVEVIAPMGQHAPEPHLLMPGQPPVRLWNGDVHRWWVGRIGGTEIRFEPPDELTIRQFGIALRGVRIKGPEC